jgi:hypothetical protein
MVNPAAYLSRLATAIPILWLGTLSPVPPFLVEMLPAYATILAAAGLLLALVWLSAVWPLLGRNAIIWALVFYVLALLPQASAGAMERGLYLAMVPASIVLGHLVSCIGPLVKRATPVAGRPPRWSRIIGWASLLYIMIPGFLLSAVAPWAYIPGMEQPTTEFKTAIPHIQRYQPEHIIIVNTSNDMLTLYAWDAVKYLTGESRDVWTLASVNSDFYLQKTNPSTVTLSTNRSGWLGNYFARMIRARSHLTSGAKYVTPLFDATLKEVTESKTDVLSVAFDFRQPLESSDLLFLYWNGAQFEPFDVAGLRVGESVTLEAAGNAWSNFL